MQPRSYNDSSADGICVLLLVLALPIVGLAGCSSPKAPGSGSIVVRLAENDPGELLYEAGLFEPREAFSWNPGEEGPDLWSIEVSSGEVDEGPGGLRISAAEGPITLTRSASLDAREVHLVQAAVGGMRTGQLRLCWARAGEENSDFHCVGQRAVETRNPIYTFKVANYRLWSGEVTRLQLQLRPAGLSRSIRVGHLTGQRLDVREERLAAALGRSWKVTLERDTYRDTRTALLAPPGIVIEKRLRVPRAAALQLSSGLQEGVAGPVDFRVTVRRRSTGDSALIFERSLGGGEAFKGTEWHDARVDLSPFAGEVVDLVLETEAPEPFDIARGFPLWGHPEVVAPSRTEQRSNVVLISIDTLRPDHLSLYGYPRETSPNVDAWARACGTTFESVVAAAPWTLPSHVSIFTGLDALSHGVNHESAVPTSFTTLAEVLRRSGYATVGITGGGYLNANYGFSQGFDRYLAWRHLAQSAAEPESGVEEVLKWLDTHRTTPFFLFFHTYAVHTPYLPRQPYLSRFRQSDGEVSGRSIGTSQGEFRPEDGFVLRQNWIWLEDPAQRRKGTLLAPSEIDWGRDLYDAGIAYLDAKLARLFEGLEQAGLDRSTLVVLTSDHGESLGEKGHVSHSTLYDQNLLVPLVVALPGCDQGGRRVPTQVRSVDLVPTVLELLDVDSSSLSQPVDGVSLVPLIEGKKQRVPEMAWSYAALSSRGVALRVDNRLKYIFNNSVWEPVRGDEELYSLNRDPEETHNRVAEHEHLKELRRKVAERLAATTGGRVRFRFSNELSVPLRGRLVRSGADWGSKPWSKIKSWNLPAGRLSLTSSKAVAFHVETQEGFDVVLETAGGGFLVECAVGSGKRFSSKFDLDGDGHWAAHYSGSSWRESDPPDPGAFTGLQATWSGQWGSASADPAQIDPELVEQLRALGYLE